MKRLLVVLAAVLLLTACSAPEGSAPPEPEGTGPAEETQMPAEESDGVESFLAGLFTGPVTASGSCTDSLDWHFSDGLLVITGQGALPEYFPDDTLPWLEYTDQVRRVVIMEGCTEVGNGNFQNLPILESVVLPESVTEIRDHAFWFCGNLWSITLPDGLTEIAPGVFSSCKALEFVEIPYGVTSIGDGAFGDCSALSYVEIPDTVTSIGSTAFALCDMLTLWVPDSVTEIGALAFNRVPQVYYSDPLGTGYTWGAYQIN